MALDPAKFNTDPKHEKDREDFDALTEASINRVLAKKASAAGKPAPTQGFFESLFASPAGDTENIFDQIFGGK